MEAGASTDTQLHASIMHMLQSKAITGARNAPVALGALFAVTPLPPGSPADAIDTLLATLFAPGSPPAVAAGAATGVVAVFVSQADADSATAQRVMSALLARAAADAAADADAAAAQVVALGELAVGYGLRFRKQHSHAAALVSRVFTLTAHMLAECMPGLHDHIAEVTRQLPGGWAGALDAETQAVVDAVCLRESHETAACEAAAVRTLLRLLEASDVDEAGLLSVIPVAILQVARAETEPARTPRGAEVGALAGMSRMLRVLRAKDLQARVFTSALVGSYTACNGDVHLGLQWQRWIPGFGVTCVLCADAFNAKKTRVKPG